MAIREDTHFAHGELSLALAIGTLSSLFFAICGFGVSKPGHGVAYLIAAIGSALLALGLWRDEGAFFGSRLSRSGLVLVGVSRGILATFPIHIPTQNALVARDDYALAVLTVGIAIAGVAQLPRFRSAAGVRIGLLIASAASFAGGVSDIINLVALDEVMLVRISLVVATITAWGSAAALYVVVQRDAIFERLAAR